MCMYVYMYIYTQVFSFNLTLGIYFVEEQRVENAIHSPSMSKVLYIKMTVASNDNTEAVKDTLTDQTNVFCN